MAGYPLLSRNKDRIVSHSQENSIKLDASEKRAVRTFGLKQILAAAPPQAKIDSAHRRGALAGFA